MSGDGVLIVLVLMLFFVLCLAAWLVHQNVKMAQDAQKATSSALELVDKQSQLIASKDALAYQAIRATDTFGSYDEGSNMPEVEEIPGGAGTGNVAQEVGFNGDPFVAGTVFGNEKL